MRYVGPLVPARLCHHLQNIRRFIVSKDSACHRGTYLSFAGLRTQRVPSVPGEVFLVDSDLSEGAWAQRWDLSSVDSDLLHERSAPLKTMRV